MRRWIRMGYVDATLPLTYQQRREAETRSNAYASRKPMFIVKVVLMSIALPVGVIGGGAILAAFAIFRLGVPWYFAAIGYVVASVFAAVFYANTVWSWYARPVRRALRDMGHDICIDCGYWLRELPPTIAKCPECGAKKTAMAKRAEGTP